MRHTTHNLSQDHKQLSASDFHSLGVRDLLDARDQFHVHLAHKTNVFSTAIGRYLIRDTDRDVHEVGTGQAHERHPKAPPRTLLNSTVTRWSWPCILVFVKQWQTLEDLIKRPEDVVPPFVYMADGRIVPVCVVLAESADLPARALDPSLLAASSLGVGSPVYVDAQGMRRMGTIACMVSDGSDFYVLTNTHLAGEVGRPVRALIRGVPMVVGSTLGTPNLTERTFSDVYPSLPGRDAVVNIDAAIVRLEDANVWQADALTQSIGDVADFSAGTASLSWIGKPVAGRGAASGEMRGEVKALFYRYKSVGGRDYVADFVIGTRSDDTGPLVTQPGDSGSLWCLDGVVEPDKRSPFGLEWGGQRISNGPGAGQFLQFSLATSMAVILRELNLDLLAGPAAERFQYWGPVGHFKIGQQACFLVGNQALQKFFIANINNLSFSSDEQLALATHLQAKDFVPLSDVPDVVWKTNINRVKPEVARAMENWNHYADIDLPGGDGQTLIARYEADEDSLNHSTWLSFYQDAPLPSASTARSNNQGALPFRVWQVFAQIVEFAKNGDGASFLAAAGCLAHYVGDACQPLHSSQHSDGLNGASTGVHATYEDHMVDAHADDIAARIGDAIKNLSFTPRAIHSPRDAAKAAMDLMIFAQQTLPPETICQIYDDARPGGGKSATKAAAVLDALWENCGEQTIEVIAAGAVTLGAMWAAAWKLSGASKSSAWLTTVFDGATDLMPIYEDKDFLRSLHLAYLGQDDLPGSDAPQHPPPAPHGDAPARSSPKNKTAQKRAATKARGVKATAKRPAPKR
ncbi:hypothetical protein BN1232_04247 [Mycobacterium lentiflavum]|uniref:Nal1 C-terminal domain-containing protein n=1 Tax=Mycobacterium lentiflavum TaxID=141349 RepID=A0A0E4CPR0_MYCLN|nr:hypothetical protein [Mycobacterium lentiflavum]CQD18505.1 hypothetical protein BN1232_04247 [Mycobacterium lentiflavum]